MKQNVFSSLAMVVLALVLSPLQASAQNPLPPPNHSLDFGYFFVEWKGADYLDEVSCYSNIVYVTRDSYDSAADWQSELGFSLARAQQRGEKVHLALDWAADEANSNDGLADIQGVLNAAAPYWSIIERVELADEPNWSLATIEDRYQRTLTEIANRGLAAKPIGVTHQASYIGSLSDSRFGSSSLQWVGVSIYVDPPGSACPSDNRSVLSSRWNSALAKLGTKPLVVVGQSYDRNGCWHNIPTLVDLQVATYELVAQNPRVVGLLLFSYGRENLAPTGTCSDGSPVMPNGGAHFHPELKVAHQLMAERIFNTTMPAACGIATPTLPAPPTCGTIPTSPSGLSATANVYQVNLAWSDNSNNENTFELQRSVDGGAWTSVATLGANQATWTDAGAPLPPVGGSSNYSYRVRAANGLGASAFSNVAAITLFREAPSAVPGVVGPQGCVNTVRPTYQWTAVPKATRYYLTATRSDIENFFINNSQIPTTSFAQPFDLSATVSYRWKVKACNNVGCAPYTASIYFTPLCTFGSQPPVPIAPLNCVGSSQPTLTWTTVPGANQYKVAVYRVVDISNDVLVYYQDVSTAAFTPPAPLTAGQEYRFKVKAKATGVPDGPFSRHRYFTPLCPANPLPGTAGPIAPWGTAPAANVSLTWEVARAAVDYFVWVRTLAGTTVASGWFSASSLCSGAECSYTLPISLAPGSYTWSLQTRNALGVGPWSPSTTFTAQ